MSFDFKTPGRTTASAASAGKSSSRRVVRSALEQVLDTASPDLENERVIARQALMQSQPTKAPTFKPSSSSPERRFTVSYAAAPQLRKSTESAVDSGRLAGSKALTEEPSALLFLSPHQNKRPSTGGANKIKLPSKLNRTADSETRSATQVQKPQRKVSISNTILSSPPSTKRSLLEDVEHAREASPDTERDAPPSERTFIYEEEEEEEEADNEEKHASDSSHSSEEALFTQKDLDLAVEEALARYEKERDEEETRILEQVGAEVEQQNARFGLLQKTHDTVSAAKEVLQTQLQKMIEQYEALQETAQTLREELHEEREKANRITVELCHSTDAQKLAQQDQNKWERKQAEWRTMRQELEDNVEALRTQLQQKSDEVAQLASERDDLEVEVSQLREARDVFDDDCHEIRDRMAELGECMSSMEAELQQKDETIQRLQKKLSSHEKSHALQKESETESQEKLHKLEETLQQQTDEVRKKMYRITVLERERTELRRSSRLANETLDTFTERLKECQRALHDLDAMVRTEISKDKKGSTVVAPRTRSTSFTRHLVSDDEVSQSTTAEPSENEVTMSDEESHDDAVPRRGATTARAQSAGPTSRRQLAKTAATAVAARARTASPAGDDGTEKKVSTAALESKAKTLSHTFVDCMRLIQRVEDNSRNFHRRVRTKLARTHRSESAKQEKVEEQYTEQIGKLEDACRYLKMQLSEKEKQLKEQHTECELRGQDLETMERHTQQVRAQLTTAEKQLTEVTNEKEKAQEKCAELAERVQRCEEERRLVQVELAASEEARARLEVLQSTSKDNTDALTKAEVELIDCRSQLERAVDEKHTLGEAKKFLEEELTRAKSEKEGALNQQKEAQDQLRLLRSGQEERLRSRDGELSQLRETVASLTALQEAMQSQHEKDMRELKAANATLATSADEYQSRVTKYKRRLSEMMSDLSLLQGSEQTTLQAVVELLGEADPAFVSTSNSGAAVASDNFTAFTTDTSSCEPSSSLLETPKGNEAAAADALGTTCLPDSPAGGVSHQAETHQLKSKRLRRQAMAAVQRAVLEITRLRARSSVAAAASPLHHYPNNAIATAATTSTSPTRQASEESHHRGMEPRLPSSTERFAPHGSGPHAVEYEEMFDDYYGGLGAGRSLFPREASPFAHTPGGPAANGSPSSSLTGRSPFIYMHSGGGVPHASVFRSALSPSPTPDSHHRVNMSTGRKSVSSFAQRRSTSTGGLSGSRGHASGAVDGSVSPARPPMFGGFTAAY